MVIVSRRPGVYAGPRYRRPEQCPFAPLSARPYDRILRRQPRIFQTETNEVDLTTLVQRGYHGARIRQLSWTGGWFPQESIDAAGENGDFRVG